MMLRKFGFLAGCLFGLAVTGFAQFNQDAYKDANPAELVKRNDISKENLEGLVRYYRVKKDEKRAAELEALLIKQDPKGAFARMAAFSHTQRPGTTEEQIARCESFLKAFPLKEWNNNPARQEFIYYSTHRTLGAAYFDTKQFDKFLSMVKDLNFKTENELYRWNIMRAYVFKMVSYDSLYNISTPVIKDLIAKVKDGSYLESGVFTPEKAQENADQQLDNELSNHIQLLNTLGKYAEAKTYYRHLSAKGTYGSAELNEIYLNILEKLGQKAEMKPFLEKTVKANTVTPAMFNKLKTIYQEEHKNLDGYDTYINSLKSDDERKAMEAYVKEHLTNNEYKPFALENADGQLVRSSEWGNKIVVIDFWATWCKPCIAAFPGMQMLVDKYANDSEVGIYLIGTMQNGDYKNKSVGYVKSQGFRFNLLHDAVNKENGEQDVVFKTFVPFFKSSAIPRKVVLKDGIMRYSSEGYSGSPSKLVDELSYVIELLKAEK
ncbi:TlpA family protein disulfide reductase [Filimonas effusa]|uniref:TlpA family protein disulfide reductase n=1 Tax=Filimonas effusa TaxID=2508721 RepID=A0A4Q1D3X3_9BACT|nr:TlpA disulfide reductase family protein [Filimonas effusa]RXK83120.1 TlpA family protein disulfide reductase [Filimonas effusa]